MNRSTMMLAVVGLILLPAVPAPAGGGPGDKEGEGAGDGNTGGGDEETYCTVVTASRADETVLEAPRSVEVVTAKTVETTKAKTLPELMAEVPGVLVQKTNPGGGSPMIRGLIGNKNLYLFDEIRLNNATWRTGPIQYLNLVDPFVVGSVEVLKGPGSLQYGSDALGGIINVIPLEPGFSEQLFFGGGLEGKYSSADSGMQGRLFLHQGGSGFGLRGGGTAKNFGNLVGGAGVDAQPFTGYEESDADLSLVKYFPAHGLKLKVAYFGTRISDAGRTDALYTKLRLRTYDNFHDLLYAKLAGEALDETVKYRFILSYQHSLERQRDLRFTSTSFHEVDRIQATETTVDTIGVTGTVSADFFKKIFGLTGGFDLYTDLVGSSAWQVSGGAPGSYRAPFPGDSRYILAGVFAVLKAGYSLKWGRPEIWGGARLNIANAFAPDLQDYGDVEYNHWGVIFSGGLTLLVRDFLNTGVTFSQGFRAPTLNETVLFGDTGTVFEVPNPKIKPERINTIEYLLKIDRGPVVFRGAFFYSFLVDSISRTPSTYDGQEVINDKRVYSHINTEGNVFGAEGWLELDLGRLLRLKGVKVKGGLTYARGEEEYCENGPCWMTPMQKFPPLFYSFIAGWYGEFKGGTGWFSEVVVRGADKQSRLSPYDLDDPRIPPGGTPAWTTLSLRHGFEWKPWLATTFVFDNILDRKYKIHCSGIYEGGASATVFLRISL
jgi:hemoglobin/transferrin/lactoferrin receptor protein